MARPIKAETDKRTHVVAFRLTAGERATLLAKAAAAGTALPDFVRLAALAKPVSSRPAADPAILPFALADQLRRIGVNLNQLTRLSHMGKEHETVLTGLLAEIRVMLDGIHRAQAGADTTGG